MGSYALELIRENKRTKNNSLDLGNTGITKFPDELLRCTWLEVLILSNEWWDYDKKCWIRNENKGGPNRLTVIPPGISVLKKLRVFIFGREMTTLGTRVYGLNYLNTLPNLQYLDLNFCLLKFLKYVPLNPTLKQLCLMGTGIKNFDFLPYIDDLEILDLSYNKVSRMMFLRYIKNLRVLYLNNCNLSRPDLLKRLENIKQLHLNESKLTDVKFLRRLHTLQKLELEFNLIEDYRPIGRLENLKSLNISFNKIPDLEFLKGLSILEDLKVSGVDAKDYSAIGNLNEIKNLDLSLSFAADYSFLGKLKQLETLKLAFNHISRLDFLASLENLRELDLRHNHLKRMSELLGLGHLSKTAEVNLKANVVLKEIPINVVKAGCPAIRERILAISDDEEFIEMKEVKVLLLGNPNVGKSNLHEYFETGEEPIRDQPTHGVQYKLLHETIPGFNINCWDFGGQDYFHATHRLFFSPDSVNILLWTEIQLKRTQDEILYDLFYWLRSIEQLVNPTSDTEGIEVIICENKLDLNRLSISKSLGKNLLPTLLDQISYKNKFPDLELWFTHINLKPLKFTDRLKSILEDRMKSLSAERIYQKKYLKYLNKIRESNKPYMLLSEISDNVDDIIDTVIPIFHNMGVLLYFRSILPDKVFTEPQCLLDFLYDSILNVKLLKERRFYVSKTELNISVSGNSLDLTTEEVLKLLVHFDLIFQTDNEPDIYYFPQYMPPPDAEIKFILDSAYPDPNIYITSDYFLMNLAMLKIFARYGTFAEPAGQIQHRFWKDAVVIEKKGSKILVQLDRANNTIVLRQNVDSDSVELQDELINFILNINTTVRKNSYSVENESSNFGDLLSTRVKWQSSTFDIYICHAKSGLVKWEDMMNPVFQQETLLTCFHTIADAKEHRPSGFSSIFNFNKYIPPSIKNKMKKSIFICYARENMDEKRDLQRYLVNLVSENKADIWDDGQIKSGDDWDEKIREKLDSADICILLISQHLISSKYVNQVEFKAIMERQSKKKCRIIPMILEDCDWKNWHAFPDKVSKFLSGSDERDYAIKTFQFLPLDSKRRIKPLKKWRFKEEAWLQVADQIREFCA